MLIVLGGCVSRDAILTDYQEVQYADASVPSKDMAIVVFLIDGLSLEILEKAKVPALRKYFGKVHLGHTGFPSTTYPNISSLLTARPIGAQPIVGNQMRFGQEVFNFEKPKHRPLLNEQIEKLTVFTELAQRNLKSVSLAHYFRAGASVHYHTDLEVGLAYLHQDYARVDDKLIDSLNRLLSETVPREWPFLTFVHLAGVDSLAHDHGPGSPKVTAYLEAMDRKLAPILSLLESAEQNGKKITAMLTSDHGFTPFESQFNVEKFLQEAAPGTLALNETRYASLYFENPASREGILSGLEENPELEMFVERRGNRIEIESAQFSASVEYLRMPCPTTHYGLKLDIVGAKENPPAQCPEEFDRVAKPFVAPFFVSNIARYFQADLRPDALLFAAPRVSFADNQKGGHGGATREEVLVPVLLRNVQIRDESVALATYELLKPVFRK